MTTNPKRYFKGEFALCQTLSILFNFIMFAKFSGIECERTVSINVRKRKKKIFLCCILHKGVREIRKFHVTVLQRRQRNVQKSVMHVQSCCFANIILLLCCRSSCCQRRRCLSPPLLWARNFAAMVTWRRTSPFYSKSCYVNFLTF